MVLPSGLAALVGVTAAAPPNGVNLERRVLVAMLANRMTKLRPTLTLCHPAVVAALV